MRYKLNMLLVIIVIYYIITLVSLNRDKIKINDVQNIIYHIAI